MKRIFHTFLKDMRHHWMMILLCQAALIAYCWDEVGSWSERSSYGATNLSGLIHLVLVLSWCLFIFRLVQDESLVGDRQFWITRPYEWKELVAEKVLMVLVFLNLPLLIAGMFLLAKAGFSPAPHIPGLLGMQLYLFVVPMLPLLALASVTRSLVSAMVTLLALMLVLLGIAVFPLFFHRAYAVYAVYNVAGGISVPATGGGDGLGTLVIALVSLAAIGLQYARRKTFQSRLWLVGGLLVTEAISMVTAYATRHRDPFPPNKPAEIAFHAGLDPIRLLPPKAPAQENEAVAIGLPLQASGLPADTVGDIRGVRVVLEGPGGVRWDGRWHRGMQLLGAGDNRWRPVYEMDPDEYQRLKNVLLKAYVSLSVDLFREQDFETVAASAGEFAVPGLGRCRVWSRGGPSVRCNSPLVQPAMVILRVDPAASTCPVEDVGPPAPVYGVPYAWQRGRQSAVAGGISPVAASYFNFWYFNDRASICPGAPILFSFPRFVENVRRDFVIENVHLDDYRQPTFEGGMLKAADGTRLGLPPRR